MYTRADKGTGHRRQQTNDIDWNAHERRATQAMIKHAGMTIDARKTFSFVVKKN